MLCTRSFERFIEVVGATGRGSDVLSQLVLYLLFPLRQDPLDNRLASYLCGRTTLPPRGDVQCFVEFWRKWNVQIFDCGSSHGNILPR